MRVVYTRPDGGVSIVIPAEAARMEDESEDAFLARIVASNVPADASDVRIVDAADIPSDRTFRNAWIFDGSAIDCDMVKAKDITKERLRGERKPLLEAQDILFMKAQESGASTTAIVAEKNRLRDITQLADAAEILDELKAITCSPINAVKSDYPK